MRKIPTLFQRDWTGDRSRVTRSVTPGCEWVLAGEGQATRKFDGTCCMVRDGILYKRRELRRSETPPSTFEAVGVDEETGKTVGWVPVGDDPEDQYYREAISLGLPSAGTFELIGPKVQGNPERATRHELVRHGIIPEDDAPRNFDDLSSWLAGRDIEGIVWHHPDGRMAKIKGRDFGHKRKPHDPVE
jgi:hypothetical protein